MVPSWSSFILLMKKVWFAILCSIPLYKDNYKCQYILLEIGIRLLNIKNNEPEKILSKKFLCFCNMCSRTFYDFIEKQKELNNIPYKNKNDNFSKIRSINIPIYSIIGTKDGGENSEEYMKTISENCKKGKFDIINGAKHNFDDDEEYLSKIILDFINVIW